MGIFGILLGSFWLLRARIKPWAQRSQNYFIIIGDWGKAGGSQPKISDPFVQLLAFSLGAWYLGPEVVSMPLLGNCRDLRSAYQGCCVRVCCFLVSTDYQIESDRVSPKKINMSYVANYSGRMLLE